MKKIDWLNEALKVERCGLRMEEEAVQRRHVVIEALEAALKAEEEAIQYDAYVEEQVRGDILADEIANDR